MLGPIVGGLIVGYFHWSFIFFVNIPIGLAGLCMAYLQVPDYREPTNPLDVAGLILFGSGVAPRLVEDGVSGAIHANSGFVLAGGASSAFEALGSSNSVGTLWTAR
jgi:MFS family permease